MKADLLEMFTFNDFIAPEKPTAHLPGQAHVVCAPCANKYDVAPEIGKRVPPAPEGDASHWYVWMLDHDAYQLVAWMQRHLRRWHPDLMREGR
jgi:hypothetical protein